MRITEALRELVHIYGLEGLFNRTLCTAVLAELAPGCERERSRIQTAFTCEAIDSVKEAMHDVTKAERFFQHAEHLMITVGESIPAVAAQTIYYFKRAFGFPSYREYDRENYGKVSEKEGESEIIYEGEIKDGKPNGICTAQFYRDGELYSQIESVWIHGKRNGYCRAVSVNEKMPHTEGFLVNDEFCGVQTITYPDGKAEKMVS